MELSYQLTGKEYREFLHWYKRIYLKMKHVIWGQPDFSNIRKLTRIGMKEDCIIINTEGLDLRLLYSAVSGVYETELLFILFDLKEFWALPKRVIESRQSAAGWRQDLEDRRRTHKNQRFSFAELEKNYREEGFSLYRYTRTVEDITEAVLALHHTRREMKQLRKLNLFPYRLVGEQLLAAGERELFDYSERAVVRYSLCEFAQAFMTKDTLYLLKRDGKGILLPLPLFGDTAGAERFVKLCNKNLNLKKIKTPVSARWGISWRPALAVCLAVILAGAGIGVGNKVRLSGMSAPKKTVSSNAFHGGLEETVPDQTIFDVRQEDHTFVSSNLFYKISLPDWGFEVNQDVYNSIDTLTCDLGRIWVSSTVPVKIAGYDFMDRIPKTKKAFEESMGESFLQNIEVVDYTYEKCGDYIVVRRVQRSHFEEASYDLALDLWGGAKNYSISVTLGSEEPEMIEAAGKILDSFRIVDTSVGISKEMEERKFHGYYGQNLYMTSCLVLMNRELSRDEISDGLDQVKKIKGNPSGSDSQSLAVRTPQSQWLGIDCGLLQQNCTRENAVKVSQIFQAPVILYDEYDGDLLMVAYSDADQKPAYERATSHSRQMLEEEFQCYGKEQELPEFLLDYIDISEVEAEKIWKGEDYVFQFEKWSELVSHMTKLPIPEEFIGTHGIEALDNKFEVIRR